MEKTFLFLDDVRNPVDVANYINASLADLFRKENWIIARDYKEFCDWIEKNGAPDCVAFDHDLADEHYRDSMYNPDEHYSKYYTDGTFKEKTGYDCAKFLKEFCEINNFPYPEVIICHSMNPIGKKNIYDVFQSVCKENLY